MTRRTVITTLLVLAGFYLGNTADQLPEWKVFELKDLAQQRAESKRAYIEFLRVPSMNAGMYELVKGAVDRQQPHDTDEIYYVTKGTARFRSGNTSTSIGPGSIIFVKAGEEHKFEDITADLQLLVVFAGESAQN